MGATGAARKLASAAALGGGGLSVLGAGLYGVLVAEAKFARKVIGVVGDGRPPNATGWYGRGRPGPAIRIALLGDSSAAGYGVDRVEDTTGAHLATGVAAQADRRVHLRSFAVVGAQSSALAEQVDAALGTHPDLAVVLIGANDVTHTVLPSASVRHLAEGVRRLREAGVAVVVGTCPDLGTIRPIPPPLKQVAREWSRRLAAAQTITVVENGGRSVSLGDILGPEFDAAPAVLFGPDRFHPSADGYKQLASVLIPSCLAALDLLPEDEALPEPRRREGILPVAAAAVRAARTPGTEVDGTEVGGNQRGLRGRWVELRHRRRRPSTEAESPDEHEEQDPDDGLDPVPTQR
ncbi:SGNH/GDSL hydrolase family protein [Nocardioides ganghwensis]|uniref:SGNH/GDSL hydrolase family protein n=1 Tax=Nocardioides ganghwensis TaxID=252230 RepID=A0A4Q2SBM0_9ACTN|nr:SGNH/GDSL hydrolase family protein [Nocardioides ganghwensis]MBD3944224.1 SGNH/GDSL hydrolase family protein [Nocardioides ganghwensis]RYB99107.1 SGNH/GDSL hydrolase family protein [Nocardioides ganghwensis]